MTHPVATAQQILDFWFANDHGEDLQGWMNQAKVWFQGGMDPAICERFGPTLEAAERGELDGWASTAPGRLALLLVLDQFPRSIHRGSARAYASDSKALALCFEGLENGHFDELVEPWRKVFFTMPLGHAEGPNHLERLDRAITISDELYEQAPSTLKPLWDFNRNQPRRTREVIVQFGRHPHRNPVLGRASTPAERLYVERGEFPHNSAPQGTVFNTP